MFRDLLAQGVPVDAEHRSRTNLVALGALEHDFEERAFDSMLDLSVEIRWDAFGIDQPFDFKRDEIF